MRKLEIKREATHHASYKLIALTLIIPYFLFTSCDDTVTINNAQSGQEIGILADGNSSSGFVNDKTLSGPLNLFSVGKMTPGAGGEVIAFSNFRPPAININIPWTNGNDGITMSFANQITIPVTVWIVNGPFNTSRQNAINMCINTSAIWNSERMGVDFNPFQIIDATTDPQAANYLDFTCTMQAGIQNDIGRTAGRINIYVVRTVDGGAGRGQACQIGSDFVAIASTACTELLSHEIGHDFNLTHVDGLATFDQTNIMHSASNTRQFITEGQLFRAHLSTNSAINDTYNARPGLPIRDCAPGTTNNSCPALNKRIWADGSFPAN
jgi:hypothetical protein